MGCCQSRSDSPAPGSDDNLPQDSSRANIHHQTSSRDGNEPSSSRRHATNSVIRPNKPIERPRPLETSPKNVSNRPPPWTRSHLEQQRRIFFETRVTGRPEIWDALKLVCECLRQDDIAEAQAIMDAANITCPHGKVGRGRTKEKQREGVYDEQGQLYDLPYWVVTDPQDIIEDEGKDIDAEAEEDEEDEANEASLARRQEKGKGRAQSIGEELRLKVRLSDRASDMEVTIGSKQNVSVAIRAIKDQINVRHCRLVYLGKALDEGKTLEAQGWKNGQVVNAFVFEGDENAIQKSRKR
ncbi:hypothetical protein AC579_3609 [Pseudocercospora musae]|uniref:Ubiquitin-like domain-containing protein n=1 Tax=Pseudocercospora musae TaxID=113226 RepID=A0A139ISQ0_9PEZI|nr:hypothetical protein AC579_3609 [Pseudocercospora musae]